MKRFRSPLEKILRIQQQQLRLAESAVLRALAAVHESDGKIANWQQEIQQTGSAVTAQMQPGSVVSAGGVQATRHYLSRLSHQIADERVRGQQLREQLQTARAEYQRLSARCSGLESILQKKRAEHRRTQLLAEQVQLEELFSARNVARAQRRHER